MSDGATQDTDGHVAAGAFSSRAACLSWSAEREAQRQRALADLQRLREERALPDPEPGLSAFHRRNAQRTLSHLDECAPSTS